ncbi:aldo/keto reductase [Breznakiella homolactica]|uniref:Aldo/keto reductase n=1 Tax=Breznakiella homolactica TaxID=2798577 RepID=A0A7T8B8V3_9SPIR|nr:aldo/keto reductase [Breznakiella homolactica]QQO07701.1 aldo/keto reductase [Breznakiella homolactica]
MLYNKFKDKNLSALGMGAMRLPTQGGSWDAPVDEEKAREIIEYVYEQGVNYFDTAFLYHSGESEKVLGRALAQYPRESFYLADKFWYQSMTPDMTIKQFFEIQLDRCGVEYFDFYLVHNVSDETIEDYFELDRTQKMMEYLESEKAAGRIRHMGFSCHSSTENMVRFLDFHDFDFVQIQCNYLDWTFQDARGKYEILTERGIQVVVMEPVRGGALASHGERLNALLKAARPDESVAAWAFRFLQSLENVAVVLSGMSTMDQARDNAKTFGSRLPLNEAEKGLLETVMAEKLDLVPCTACRYCQTCPRNLDIPALISLYNESLIDRNGAMWGIRALSEEQQPGNCVSCGICSKACPQGIDIPGVLAGLDRIIQEAE